jgi:inositol phosphorylceramide mannosyltransferase catalytic subunit
MWQKLIRRLRRLHWGVADPSFGRVVRYLLGLGAASEPRELDARALQKQIGKIEPVALTVPSTHQQTNGIPHVIFQTWKSRVDIPINYRYWRKTFIDHNPGFDCVLWDDADNRAFITKNFGWFLPVYDRYPKEIFRADAIRPFFLLANGGFYADMDTECLAPLDRTLATGDVLLGRMGADPSFDHSIPNAIMASKPHELFWALVIAMMIERANDGAEAMRAGGPETYTGPILLKHAADFYRGETEARIRERAAPVIRELSDDMRSALHAGTIEILKPDAWYPVDWTNPFHRMLRRRLTTKRVVLAAKDAHELFPSSTLVTYWSHSW